MGIFDFFRQKPTIKQASEVLDPVFNLLSIDLKSMPDSSFILIEVDIEQGQTKSKKYQKELSVNELGLFESIQIIEFSDGSKNYIIEGTSFNERDIPNLTNLIKQLFYIYGVDDYNRGAISKEELHDIENDNWDGRYWTLVPNKRAIRIDANFSYDVSLTIWTSVGSQ